MSTPNERPYMPDEYDAKIRQTIPFSQEIYEQSLSMIDRYKSTADSLLDVGCGAGMFEQLLRERYPRMKITGIDPAADMLEQAVTRQVENITYRSGTILDLEMTQTFDIVTALMSHHFWKEQERAEVMKRVYQILNPGGIYIAFENIIPEDAFLKEQELNRWADYQIRAGKSPREAEVHKARCGVFYHPLTVAQHESVLKKAGFSRVYVFWRSYMQMGIMGIKG